MAAVHASPIAGSWYPGDARELERLLASQFEESQRRTGEYLLAAPLGFVVPHAGLIYSGTIAAAAYRYLQRERPERVVVLGFSHRGGPRGVVTPDIDSIETPLGRARVERGPFPVVPESRVCDHSIEIQLPALQYAAPRARIVPLYVGQMESEERKRAAEMLAGMIRPGTILVASSDLTHYGRAFYYQPFPVDAAIQERLRELDYDVLNAMGSIDPELFFERIRAREATVCGVAPIALLLETLALWKDDDVFQQVLDYATSGEITGDYHHSVSYAAVGYFPAKSFTLDEADREALLHSSRETLDRWIATAELVPAPVVNPTAALMQRRGAFVSLHENGELRGCVGNCRPAAPLAEAIAELTISAATEDTRFEPCRRPMDIEISLLSPFKRIADSDRISIGKHGCMLTYGGFRSILLPQVAKSEDWTTTKFLRILARKAGLHLDACSTSETQLHIFCAQVFRM